MKVLLVSVKTFILMLLVINKMTPYYGSLLKDKKPNMEDRLKTLEKDVKSILNNHLPHINMKIAVLISQMVIVMAGLAYLIFV